MNYKDLPTDKLISLWEQKREEMANKASHECLDEMGELFKLRKEIEKRQGAGGAPKVDVNFEQYVTD